MKGKNFNITTTDRKSDSKSADTTQGATMSSIEKEAEERQKGQR